MHNYVFSVGGTSGGACEKWEKGKLIIAFLLLFCLCYKLKGKNEKWDYTNESAMKGIFSILIFFLRGRGLQ